MKNKISIVILVLLIIGLVVSRELNRDSVIKIGIVGPFSGSAASFGDLMQRGIDLAELSLTPGQKANLHIIKEDDMCNGKDAVSAVRKLIEVDHVNYVIGPLCNESSLATEKLFEDSGIVSITVGLPSNTIADMGPNHFSFSPEIEYLMKTISTKMAADGLTNTAVIRVVSAFEDENYRHFVKYFVSQDRKIVAVESMNKGFTDFRSAILKIKQAKPDSVMIIASRDSEMSVILRQLMEAGLSDLPKFSIHAVQGSVIGQSKVLAEGMVYPYPADKVNNKSASEYAKSYIDSYGTDPDVYSANVYDGLRTLIGFIEKCGYENKECVRNMLANLKNYQGANGNLSVDERGVGIYKEIMLKVVKNEMFVPLQ